MSVLVVGGTGGIGSELVRRFASAGQPVVFSYLRASETAAELVAEVERGGGKATAVRADVRDHAALQDLVSAAEGLETVVFAAASGVLRPLAGLRGKHLDWTYEINQRAFALLYDLVLAALRERRGSLVALTSVGSRRPMANYGFVGPTKAAIESMVRYMAVEAGPDGVRVNSVCAGVVATKALDSFPDREQMIGDAVAHTPMGRLVTVAEVASVVTWLTGPDATMITGHNLVIDGGWELLHGRRTGD